MQSTTVTSNATKAVEAYVSLVDAYNCQFEMDACEVVTDGHIKMWYRVEAQVHWASKDGIDSGNPVVDANVTFIDQHGTETAPVYSNATGSLGTVEVLAWHIIHSVAPVEKNPYSIKVSLSSFHTVTVMTIDRPYRGDDALTLLLWDPDDPVVLISGPEDGSAHNTFDIAVSGFATDRVSGVFSLTVQVDDGEPIRVTGIEEDGSYSHLLEAVPEGWHRLRVTAHDAGWNNATASMMVEVDRTPPRLLVTDPSSGLHTNGTRVKVSGEVENGVELLVNMRELTTFGGAFEIDLQLNEGPNYIGLTATDRAGNIANVIIWVYRDTFDPVLQLFGPSDGIALNASEVRIWGQAEGSDTVTLSLLRRFTNIIDRPIYPDEGGHFELWAELEEGENEVRVTARDLAGNTVTIVRRVTLDMTPPALEVLSPDDDALLKEHKVTVVFTVSGDADQVYVNGKRVLGTGTLETVVMLGEGENPITVQAMDLLWNMVTVELTVLVDSVPPALVLTEPGADTIMTNEPAVAVRGRASDGDLNGITVTVDGHHATVTADGKFYHQLLLGEDGTHRVEVVARDRAGNIARASFTVELRTAEPVLSLVFEPAGDRVDPGTVMLLRGATVDHPLNVTIVHDAAGERREHTLLLMNASFEHHLELVRGTNTITVRAEDAYGNWNVSAPHVVEVREEVEEDPAEDDTMYLVAAVLVAVALVVLAYVIIKRP
jgi:hypothetical protein